MRRHVKETVALTSPFFWCLLGTPLPPLNIAMALAAWFSARLFRARAINSAARCLNVQITYTVIFYIPVGIAIGISALESSHGKAFSIPLIVKLLSGFPLGLISLGGILALAFFNASTVAHLILGLPFQDIPRIRFIRELPLPPALL